MNPHIHWLADRWDLAPEHIPLIERLLAAEAGGSTALEIEGPAELPAPAFGPPSGSSPVVVVKTRGRAFLQSRRLHEAEAEIAARILGLASRSSPQPPGLKAALKALFPDADAKDPQRLAAARARTHDLLVLTGGPGTGKTHTLARALALLPGDRPVRLAAPTGKAAQRMKDAITAAADSLPESFDRAALREAAASCQTIQSLLHYNPDQGTTRPLPKSAILILDECSMIDVYLWQTVLRALPDDGKLILVGDPNQLESVGQGRVFAAIAEAPPPVERIHLVRARRFENSPGIQALARAIENADPEAALQVVEGPPSDGLAFYPLATALDPHGFPPSIQNALRQIARADTPAEALKATQTFCILTAHRHHFVGAEALNQKIQAFLAADAPIRHVPVIINKNDPETGRRNGSMGVIRTADQNAFFPKEGASPNEIPASRLPEFSPAWTITIHRAQGSEYDRVLVVLPRHESPLATRELLYTAITRARNHLTIAGTPETIRAACVRPSMRISLLPYALRHDLPAAAPLKTHV